MYLFLEEKTCSIIKELILSTLIQIKGRHAQISVTFSISKWKFKLQMTKSSIKKLLDCRIKIHFHISLKETDFYM